MFGGFDPLRHDAWRGLRRDEDDIRAAEMGPSAAVYVNRFGGDVRTFGKLLPDTSRKIASTLLRCHRLAPSGAARRVTRAARRVPTGIKKLPVDIIATRIFPYLVEDEDRTDESVEGAIRSVSRLLRIETEMFRNINLDAVRNWSEGNRSGIWAKFVMDFASGYDQTVAIHAVYIIHTLWWRLNEADEDANDMLREVSQRWNTAASTEALQRSEASLLLCAGALELATALYHKTLDTNFHSIFRSSGPQLRVADVGDYIQSRIGWRVLLTTPDNMLAQHYEIPALYGGMMYWQRDQFRERCNAVARVAACVELLYPWPPAILAAAIILHVRQTMGIDPAWTPALDRATGCFSEAQLEPTRRDLVRWVPDPANPRWPWVPVGGDDSSDDADY